MFIDCTVNKVFLLVRDTFPRSEQNQPIRMHSIYSILHCMCRSVVVGTDKEEKAKFEKKGNRDHQCEATLSLARDLLQCDVVIAAAKPFKQDTVIKYVTFKPEAVVCMSTLTDNSRLFKRLTQSWRCFDVL